MPKSLNEVIGETTANAEANRQKLAEAEKVRNDEVRRASAQARQQLEADGNRPGSDADAGNAAEIAGEPADERSAEKPSDATTADIASRGEAANENLRHGSNDTVLTSTSPEPEKAVLIESHVPHVETKDGLLTCRVCGNRATQIEENGELTPGIGWAWDHEKRWRHVGCPQMPLPEELEKKDDGSEKQMKTGSDTKEKLSEPSSQSIPTSKEQRSDENSASTKSAATTEKRSGSLTEKESAEWFQDLATAEGACYEAEQRVIECAAHVAAAKANLKAAEENFSGVVKELRALVRDAGKGQGRLPFGEEASKTPLLSGVSGLVSGPKTTEPEPEEKPQEVTTSVYANAEGQSLKIHTPVESEDETWKDTPLTEIKGAPKKVVEVIADQLNITTLGKLSAWLAERNPGRPSNNTLKDLAGVGDKNAEKFEDALMNFWSARNKKAKEGDKKGKGKKK